MAYKIKWKSGGETAELYSSKELALKVLKRSKKKGSVVKASLDHCPRSPLSNNKCVWVRNKASSFGGKDKGFVYHSRAIKALNKAEKKRVVKR